MSENSTQAPAPTVTIGDKSYDLASMKPELKELIFCVQKADQQISELAADLAIQQAGRAAILQSLTNALNEEGQD